MAGRQQIGPTPIVRDRNKRTLFGEFGCNIYAWPSTGGVIIRHNADLVELKQLNFDPLNPPTQRYADQEKEDNFCMELRKVGGKWWRSEKRYLDVLFKDWNDTEPSDEELTSVWLGWLKEGGLLVLEFRGEEELPDDTGRLRMASSMEERCQILKDRFDGKFYDDPSLYPGLADARTV